MTKRLIFIAILATAGWAGASEASGMSACPGPAPMAGALIHGPVLDIPDAATLCVATGAAPAAWVGVPVARLQTSRAVLMAAAFGQTATCVIGADGAGACSIDSESLADKVRRPEIVKAAMQWRQGRRDIAVPTQLASVR